MEPYNKNAITHLIARYKLEQEITSLGKAWDAAISAVEPKTGKKIRYLAILSNTKNEPTKKQKRTQQEKEEGVTEEGWRKKTAPQSDWSDRTSAAKYAAAS